MILPVALWNFVPKILIDEQTAAEHYLEDPLNLRNSKTQNVSLIFLKHQSLNAT